jgi:hypothetical protein
VGSVVSRTWRGSDITNFQIMKECGFGTCEVHGVGQSKRPPKVLDLFSAFKNSPYNMSKICRSSQS